MRGRESGAVPTVFGDIRLDAEGKPDVAGRSAAGEGLVRGTTAEWGQHQVAREHPPIGVAELVFQGLSKLTQSHDLLCEVALASHDGGVEVRDEFIRHCVGERFEAFDDGETFADFTHDD